MPLVYRHNIQERPRPPKQRHPEEYRPGDGLDWRPRILHFRRPSISLTTTPLPVESPKTRQPDVVAADAPQEIQMAAKKKAKMTAAPAARPGVIATIIETISRDRGATADEIVAVLVKAFPDRDADGMRNTVLLQASKNATSKERDETRGLIYYRRGRK